MIIIQEFIASRAQKKFSMYVMENLTRRLIIVDINTIKRTTREVIKEKPNKTSTEEKEERRDELKNTWLWTGS